MKSTHYCSLIILKIQISSGKNNKLLNTVPLKRSLRVEIIRKIIFKVYVFN